MEVEHSTCDAANIVCTQDTEMKDADTTMDETTTTTTQHQVDVKTKKSTESLPAVSMNDCTTADKSLDQSSDSKTMNHNLSSNGN
jgi:hypothetical protein